MVPAKFPRVAIIGGGAAGLAACKALALEPIAFAAIDVFERRDQVGGLWYSTGASKPCNGAVSPVYKHLETNLISSVMEYSGVHFDRGVPAFPSRRQVHQYLVKYSKTVPDSVNFRLCTEVVEVGKNKDKWTVRHRAVAPSAVSSSAVSPLAVADLTETAYDALIICNGHFEVGHIPDVEGLREWDATLPGSITHAKYYDDPEQYVGKRVLIVGNLSSGSDIASQIANSAAHVYVSAREELSDVDRAKPMTFLPEITRYDCSDRQVTTAEGQVVTGIDTVIFCTGYLYSMPFMSGVLPDLVAADGSCVNDLYLQMFYIPDPSLALIGLPADIVPMPLCESQAAVAARYYSGRLELPSPQDMEHSHRHDMAANGHGRKIHALTTPKDMEYIQKLQAWLDREGVCRPGLVAPIWDEQRLLDRRNTRLYKGRRVREVLHHAERLRAQGKPFGLPPQQELYR